MDGTRHPSQPNTRVLALPDNTLHHIVRVVGRPARRVCRQFCDAYGPLDAGLRLERFATSENLVALTTTSSPGGFRHIHTLFLDRYNFHQMGPGPPAPTLLSPLPIAFPTLRSLHLTYTIPLTGPLIQPLGPLAPHLTALIAHVPHTNGAATLAATLTSLRSITLINPERLNLTQLLSSLRPLAPTLLHLSVQCRGWGILADAGEVFPILADFTHLTHFSFSRNASFSNWTPNAVRLLATAMPRLRSLACNFVEYDTTAGTPPATPDDIYTALGTRTALTSLTIPTLRNDIAYTSLGPLRLSRLHLPNTRQLSSVTTLESLLSTIAHARTLTSLDLTTSISAQTPVSGILPLLSSSLRALAWNNNSACPLADLLPLSHLTSLETLSVSWHMDEHMECPTDSQVATIASSLGHLTSLSLDLHPPFQHAQHSRMPAYPFAPLVQQVAARRALRHLRLSHWEPQWGRVLLAPLSTSLVRLSVIVLYSELWEDVRLLGNLRALRCLDIKTWGVQQGWARLQGGATRQQAAAGADSSTNIEDGGAERVPTQLQQQAGGPGQGGPLQIADAQTLSVGDSSGASPGPARERQTATGGSEVDRVWIQLPPGLRQLCLSHQCLCHRTETPECWSDEHQAALLAAAKRQDCVVRVADAEPPFSSLLQPEYDDCHGYVDGAAAEFVAVR